MEVKPITQISQVEFNKLVSHPLQSWEWGEFRKKSGVKVLRLGKFDGDKLTEVITLTFHPIPYTSWKIAYIPKSRWPSKDLLDSVYDEAKKRNCIFVKFEPNIPVNHFASNSAPKEKSNVSPHEDSKYKILQSSHPLFTKFTQMIDLTKPENEILKNMHSKTRYNIRVAEKHGVTVREKTDEKSFNEYLNLMFETTKRQGFFAHTKEYHLKMWETLKGNIAHLFTAEYTTDGHSHTLVTWILFLFNNVLYYPYGASSDKFRNVMASNLMMWEAIKFGKKHGTKQFDMWGSLGPDADPEDPWYGFHRFKQGYGATLVEFAGSYDLVIHSHLYRLYSLVFLLRKGWLSLKRKLV